MTEERKTEIVDINDPSLQMESLEGIDTEKDQFASMPVIPEGVWPAKLKQKAPDNDSPSLWRRKEWGKAGSSQKVLVTGIEARVIDPNGKWDNWPVFDNQVSTFVMRNTGTNRMVGILKQALGTAVPARVTDVDLARLFESALGGEPSVRITVQWEAYCDTCEKTIAKGMKRFPLSKNGSGQHESQVECGKCGTKCNAQPRIELYQPF